MPSHFILVIFVLIFSSFSTSASCLLLDQAKDIELSFAQKFKLKQDEKNKIFWLKLDSQKNWLGFSENSTLKKNQAQCPQLVIKKFPERVVATSTTQLSAFLDLKEIDKLIGFTQIEMVSSELILQKSKAKQLKNLPLNPNIEDLIVHKVDLLLTYAVSDSSEQVKSFSKKPNGLTVLVMNEYLEPHPLGRMEWLLVYGALLNKLPLAQSLFQERLLSYQSSIALIKNQNLHPKLLLGEYYNGKWVYPGKNSDLMKMAEDLKLDIIRPMRKNSTTTGPEFYSYEEILPLIKISQFWYLQTSYVSKEQMAQKNNLYKPFLKLHIIQLAMGDVSKNYNDYWETGVNRPDLVIKDLITIFYPEIKRNHFANHKLLWLNELQ